MHDDVPDRPSAKVAPVGCQLATMSLKIKTVTIPKRWIARQKLSPNLGRQCIWAQFDETGALSATDLGSKSAGTLSRNPSQLSAPSSSSSSSSSTSSSFYPLEIKDEGRIMKTGRKSKGESEPGGEQVSEERVKRLPAADDPTGLSVQPPLRTKGDKQSLFIVHLLPLIERAGRGRNGHKGVKARSSGFID